MDPSRTASRAATALVAALFACGPSAPTPVAESTGDSSAGGSTSPGPITAAPTTAALTTAAPTETTDPGVTTTSTGDPTTTSTGELSTSSTDPEHEFIIRSDGNTCVAGAPAHGKYRCTACDIFQQDCPPGSKCTPAGPAWQMTRCVPVNGDGVAGSPCSFERSPEDGRDDCALGFMCWGVDEQQQGTCAALCVGTPEEPMCAEGTVCAQSGDLAVCVPPCDPLAQDCPQGDLCILNNDHFLCVLDASGDEGQVNDPCEFANACDAGLLCAEPQSSSACDPDASGCCTPWCLLPDGACPNPDQTCVPAFAPGEAPPGHEDVGFCGLAP